MRQYYIVNIMRAQPTLLQRGYHIRLPCDWLTTLDVLLQHLWVQAQVATDAEIEDDACCLLGSDVLNEKAEGWDGEFDVRVSWGDEEFLGNGKASGLQSVDGDLCHWRDGCVLRW